MAAGLDPDPSAHPFEQLAADVKAQACAADAASQVGIEAVELLEDAAVLGGRDSEALVPHREAQARARERDVDLDAPAPGRVLDGVFGEGRDDLANLVRV